MVRTDTAFNVMRPGVPPSIVMSLVAPLILGNVIVAVTLITAGLAPQSKVTSNGSKAFANALFRDWKVQLAAVPVPT